MYTLNYNIKDKILYEDKETNLELLSGSHNIDEIYFQFMDDTWQDLDKTAIFIVDGKVYHQSIMPTTNKCQIPTEAYSSLNVLLGVFATRVIEGKLERVADTNLVSLPIYQGSYEFDREPENSPSATQWDLYITEINRLLRECQASEEMCNTILIEVKAIRDEILNAKHIIDDNVEEILKKINDLATLRLNEYNNNAEKLYNIYEDNAITKYNDFNENYDTKLTTFNQNYTDKTNEFNNLSEQEKQELTNIGNDVKDFAQALTFATFEVEPLDGSLYMNSSSSLSGIGFKVKEDGHLWVEL